MTDEQICELAKDKALDIQKYIIDGNVDIDSFAKDCCLAGAHSMLEEIEKLQKELDLTCKSRKYYENKYYNREGYYHDLCEKLRTPWVSVEDRLPDIGQKVITITNKGKLLLVARTTQPPHKEEGGWRWEHYVGKVTHWMQIPELKKGE